MFVFSTSVESNRLGNVSVRFGLHPKKQFYEYTWWTLWWQVKVCSGFIVFSFYLYLDFMFKTFCRNTGAGSSLQDNFILLRVFYVNSKERFLVLKQTDFGSIKRGDCDLVLLMLWKKNEKRFREFRSCTIKKLIVFHKLRSSVSHMVQWEETYIIFTGWEVRMGENCSRGLEYGPRPFFPKRKDQGR